VSGDGKYGDSILIPRFPRRPTRWTYIAPHQRRLLNRPIGSKPGAPIDQFRRIRQLYLERGGPPPRPLPPQPIRPRHPALTALRRLDCVLEPTKDKVLRKATELKGQPEPLIEKLLQKESKQKFFNTSKYTFERLAADPNNVAANLTKYLKGFSRQASDILDKFGIETELVKLEERNLLYPNAAAQSTTSAKTFSSSITACKKSAKAASASTMEELAS
jgi:hypothetical protein